MTRWALRIVAVGAAMVFTTIAGDSWAGPELRAGGALLFDEPAVDLAALKAENTRGLGVEAAGLGDRPQEFGVILWDEFKPYKPSPPPPQPSAYGQGMSTINGTRR